MLFQSFKERNSSENTAFYYKIHHMLIFWRLPTCREYAFLKMAVCGAYFLVADDIDDIMAIIDAGMLKNNTKTIKGAV